MGFKRGSERNLKVTKKNFDSILSKYFQSFLPILINFSAYWRNAAFFSFWKNLNDMHERLSRQM